MEDRSKKPIKIRVNRFEYTLSVSPNRMLLNLLREDLGLTGTKKGCGEGECGACTIVMNGKAVLACLIPALKADGAEILTVEGLAEKDKLHPLQQAFWEVGAVQCGYCTPGMLLSAKVLLDENPEPLIEEVKEAISGNLCRCTGYIKIIRAIRLASDKMRKERGESLG